MCASSLLRLVCLRWTSNNSLEWLFAAVKRKKSRHIGCSTFHSRQTMCFTMIWSPRMERLTRRWLRCWGKKGLPMKINRRTHSASLMRLTLSGIGLTASLMSPRSAVKISTQLPTTTDSCAAASFRTRRARAARGFTRRRPWILWSTYIRSQMRNKARKSPLASLISVSTWTKGRSCNVSLSRASTARKPSPVRPWFWRCKSKWPKRLEIRRFRVRKSRLHWQWLQRRSRPLRRSLSLRRKICFRSLVKPLLGRRMKSKIQLATRWENWNKWSFHSKPPTRKLTNRRSKLPIWKNNWQRSNRPLIDWWNCDEIIRNFNI